MHAARGMLAVGLLGLALLAGCASGSSAASAPVRTNQVDLPPSYVFRPATIEVPVGTTVTWTNHDNFTHTVQVTGQSEVHQLRPGESTSITFSTPGDYAYVCTLHTQNMRGVVTVR
jgi:plastocyanin